MLAAGQDSPPVIAHNLNEGVKRQELDFFLDAASRVRRGRMFLRELFSLFYHT
jgi:hypothetical protein